MTPKKLAGVTICSNELVNDSSPSALEVVGQGLVRDLRTKLDAAFFGNTVANGPDGLLSLTTQVTTGAFTDDTNLDVVAEAVSLLESVGVSLINPVDSEPNVALVLNPADTLLLSTAKTGTGSNESLLGKDATQPVSRNVLGIPLYSSPAVAAGDGWMIARDRVFTVWRTNGAEVVADSSVKFTSDQTALRAILRVGLGFPDPNGVVRVVIDGGS